MNKLYWRRINNLIEIISRISDDIVYRNIWVDKLLELLQERKIMTKKISKRQENLLKMIDKTKDDKDYQKIWERKLEELKKKEVADFFGGIVNDKR